MFNYENYDHTAERRAREVEIESIKITTAFANKDIADRGRSKGVKGISAPSSHEWTSDIARSVGG